MKYFKIRNIVSHKMLNVKSFFYAKNRVGKKMWQKMFLPWTFFGEKGKKSQRVFTFPPGSNRVKTLKSLLKVKEFRNYMNSALD